MLCIVPSVLAEQLTLADQQVLCSVSASTLLDAVLKRNGAVQPFARRSNRVTNFVSTVILQETNKKRRACVIAHMISVTRELEMQRNYLSMMAAFWGLNSQLVRRLHKTWKRVSQSDCNYIKHLESFFAPQDNFRLYRSTLSSVNAPRLICPAVLMKDLLFIVQGNPDKLDDLVNWQKIALVGKSLLHFHASQRYLYGLHADIVVQQFVNGVVASEKLLHIYSTSAEGLRRSTSEAQLSKPSLVRRLSQSFKDTMKRK